MIHRLETAPEEEIPCVVRELNEWPFARGDMFYWVTALDRFDVMLSTVCTEYNLKQVQTTPFSSNTKALILAIIDLARILFENCTNRNIYNSYEVSFLEGMYPIMQKLTSFLVFINAVKYI